MRTTKSGPVDLLWVRLYPFVVMVVIAGCAGSMGTIRPDPAATPPVTGFDGSYRNTIVVTGTAGKMMDTSWCQSPGQPIITVENGHLSYAVPHPNIPGNATPVFQATMAEDGSFFGRVNDGSLSGRVRGTHLEGRIDGVSCRYAITGDRV